MIIVIQDENSVQIFYIQSSTSLVECYSCVTMVIDSLMVFSNNSEYSITSDIQNRSLLLQLSICFPDIAECPVEIHLESVTKLSCFDTANVKYIIRQTLKPFCTLKISSHASSVQLSQYVRLTEGVVVKGRERADLERNKNLHHILTLECARITLYSRTKSLNKKDTCGSCIYLQPVTFQCCESIFAGVSGLPNCWEYAEYRWIVCPCFIW